MIWLRRPKTFACRALRADDAARCAPLHALGFQRGWSTSEFAALLIDPAVLGEAASFGRTQEIAGFALSRFAQAEAEILTIVVEPARRKSGVGSGLMQAHLGRLASRGVRSVFLEVDEQNAAALKLYARFGFENVGARPSYYRRTDGSRAGALVLRCGL